MGSLLVLMVLLCACASLSGACSCFPDSRPERFCRYDLIFRGTIEAEYKELEEPLDHDDPFADLNPHSDWVYTVRVELPVKMPENLQGNTTITMRTRTQGSLCGMRFPVDADAMFFARINDKGDITTGLCDPNAPWENLSEWDRELITDHLMDYCANPAEVTPPDPSRSQRKLSKTSSVHEPGTD